MAPDKCLTISNATLISAIPLKQNMLHFIGKNFSVDFLTLRILKFEEMDLKSINL